MLLKLTDQYSESFHYKILLTSSLPGRTMHAVSDNAVVIRGQASGFYIIKHRYSTERNRNYIKISVDTSFLKPVAGREDYFYLLTDKVRDKIKSSVEDSYIFQGVSSDTLVFCFPVTSSRRVPVSADVRFSYREQYMPFGKMQIRPDSVTIYGKESLIEGIDSVVTKEIRERNIDDARQGVIDLKKIKGVHISERSVYYFQEAGRYFENTVSVPVYVVNVPEGKQIILSPNEVSVVYREDFSRKIEYSAASFFLYADYKQIESASSGKAKVFLRSMPDGVYSVKLNPPFVEAIAISSSTE